ncbi:alpha/beta fold hydrolase [Lederbergia citrea]|uniref:alpha/beta fold hydrolase n=1 Tax=Lederbergia citrea TaxID=2833581 RepID=UPI001BCA512E|nr:alpha/beta hydrolase [Lederbergia citrea]MBS4204491.1 alpha/beta hydrolase [Lederbergia citrea]
MALFLKRKEFTIPETGIDSIETLSLGGVDQTILIQSVNPTNPVLLFVHGGPCMPVPGVVSRGQDYAVSTTTKELVKHFNLVLWDQRGAGKSFNKTIPPESMRVEQFVSDCNELIDILRERFNQEKIYLVAHSWGSIIGLSIASRYPEKLHAYVGISQILNWTENDQLCYEWVKKKAEAKGDKKTLKKLDEIGKPPYVSNVKNWLDFRSPLIKYNSMIYTSETVKHPGMIGGFKLFLFASDYSLKDIFHTFYSSYNKTYTQSLIEDFAKIDFNYSLKRIDTPIYFLHGKKDVHVNGKPVQEFFERLDAPFGKEMVWYENSSHMFHPEEAKEIEKYIIENVKNSEQ